MSRMLGPVLYCAPSNTAVTKLACRLHDQDSPVCKQYNYGMAVIYKTRARQLLVVCAFRHDLDWSMMNLMLHKPGKSWEKLVKTRSKWTLFLTPVWWLPWVMGCFQPSDADDSQFLLELQLSIFADSDLRIIRPMLKGPKAFSHLPKAGRQRALRAPKKCLTFGLSKTHRHPGLPTGCSS